ncbi:MAG: exosortase/archaeosortase family protein [Opitutales bacterium]|nr:exosortase/archaeosortase family protein [Opitutales bacterium]
MADGKPTLDAAGSIQGDLPANLLSPVRFLVGATVLAALVVLSQVRLHWGGESYYNYGWFVPFLAAYLFVRRMADQPAPAPPPRRIQGCIVAAGALLIVALLPFQLLNEVNPFWRAPLILQAGLVLLLGMATLYMIGGLRTLRHFAFPAVFCLTMIPIPWRIETEIIQLLTRQVVEATVFLLQASGYTAEVRGNLVVVNGSSVGVDDACSGIRSLQVLGMITLFLSDYFRMPWTRRPLLFAAAFVAIMFFNTTRSITLTLVVVHGGTAWYDRLHDWIGILTFGGCIALLYGLCEWIRPRGAGPPEGASAGKESVGPAPESPAHARVWYVGAAVWALTAATVFAGKEAWFLYHEERERPQYTWTVQWPERDRLNYRFADISDQIKEILTFDYGERIHGILPRGEYIDLYFYGYTGENRMRAVTSYGHQPTVCMTAIGARLVAEHEPVRFERNGLQLTMNHFKFLLPDPGTGTREEMDVFWTVWERRNMGLDPLRMETITWANQTDLALRGRRDYYRKILLVGMTNADSKASARRSLVSLLEEIVKVQPLDDNSGRAD